MASFYLTGAGSIAVVGTIVSRDIQVVLGVLSLAKFVAILFLVMRATSLLLTSLLHLIEPTKFIKWSQMWRDLAEEPFFFVRYRSGRQKVKWLKSQGYSGREARYRLRHFL